MIVYFLRHAEAEDAVEDFGRRLTPKGCAQSERVGKFLKEAGLVPGSILSSPVVRARQTAEIVHAKTGATYLEFAPWLACGMSPGSCLKHLAAHSGEEPIMLVGHEPDFGETIATLLNCDPSALRIRKASLTALDISSFSRGGGRLEFCLPVRLL
jgi:phosphohistidine phosphatase